MMKHLKVCYCVPNILACLLSLLKCYHSLDCRKPFLNCLKVVPNEQHSNLEKSVITFLNFILKVNYDEKVRNYRKSNIPIV